MKEKHIIDEIFRQKLAGHESPVSEGAFEGVVRKRGNIGAKGSLGGNVLWLLVAGVLLVGSGAYLSIKNVPIAPENSVEKVADNLSQASHFAAENPQGSEHKDGSSNSSLNVKPSAADISAISVAGAERERSMSKDQRTEIPGSDMRSNIAGSELSQEELGAVTQKDNNMAASLNSPNSTSNKGLRKNASDIQMNASLGQNTSNEGAGLAAMNKEAAERGSSLGSKNRVDVSSTQNGSSTKDQPTTFVKTPGGNENYALRAGNDQRTNTELRAGLLDVSIRPTTLIGTRPALEPVSLFQPDALHGPKDHKLFADVLAGYFALSGNWEVGKNEDDIRELTESFTIVHGFGLRGGVQLENDWTLSAGLIYNKISSQVEFNKVRYDTTIQFTFLDSAIYDPNTQSWDTVLVAEIGSVNSTTSTHLSTNNTYNTLQIPLSVGYLLKHGRIEFSVNAGVSFDLLLSKDAYYPVLYRETSTSIIQEPSSEIATLQQGSSSIRSGISLFGNVSLSYRWTDKFHVFIEPTYRSATIPFNNRGGTYFKSNYLGVLGGLRYNF